VSQLRLEEVAFELALYAFAALGMAGVWFIPARLWTIAVERRIGALPLAFRPLNLLAATAVFITIAFSIWVGSGALPHVFHCLADSRHCSGNRADGLISLSAFGGSVALVEVTWLVLARVRAQ
jgi:hypothetical protein